MTIKILGISKVLSISFALLLLILGSGILFEPEYLAGATASDAVVITQVVSSAISITDCANFTMSQTLPGLGGGTATGQCTWTVKTANGTGFSFSLANSSSTPALHSSTDSFSDYSPSQSGTPDYAFTVASAASAFGYTVEAQTAADTVAKFLDNGSACGTGASAGTDTCWLGFATAGYTVINRSASTSPSGEAEVIKFRAQTGATKVQTSGTYQSQITATATDNP